MELEKEIDFKKAGVERDALIDELGKVLPKPELEKLVLQMLQYKQNKLTPGSFHYYLAQAARGADIDPLRYKNVILYSEYVVRYESIDLIAIFDEVAGFENKLREKHFKNEDERILSNLAHCALILSQLLDTSLNSKDYEFYVANASSCEIENLQSQIDYFCAKYKTTLTCQVNFRFLKEAIPSARQFYELATLRNQALLDNTLKRMKKDGVHVAALVTGGFHSEGISELMDKEKLSYLVVMPKFDDKSGDRPYIAILTQKPREYEEEFKDSDFYIAMADDLFARGQKLGMAGESAPLEMLKILANLSVVHRLNFGKLSSEVIEKFVSTYEAHLSALPLEEREKMPLDSATLEKLLSGMKTTKQTSDTVVVDLGTFQVLKAWQAARYSK